MEKEGGDLQLEDRKPNDQGSVKFPFFMFRILKSRKRNEPKGREYKLLCHRTVLHVKMYEKEIFSSYQCEGPLFDVSYMFNLTFAKNTLVGVFRTACGR